MVQNSCWRKLVDFSLKLFEVVDHTANDLRPDIWRAAVEDVGGECRW